MTFLMISPKNRTVYNFRGDLIKTIISKGYRVVVTGPDRTDIDKIEALGASFVEIPMNKTGTSVLGDLKYCRKLYQTIRQFKPDVTLGYTVKPVVYGAIAAHLAGVKNICGMVTGGGYTFVAASLKAKLLGVVVRTLYRIGFSVTDHIIFQNEDDLEEFCAKKLADRKKCAVVNGSGVNMEHFAQKPLPQTVNFFMLSRLLKSKGVTEYLQAAKAVREKHPETNFYLLGKYETAMQDAVPASYVEPFLEDGTVIRFDETSDVRPYYEMTSVYVLPSYREGTPRTVLEAMSMGRAVITTDTNGCRSTVENGINGYLVPVGNADILAARMMEFIEDPSLAERMGGESLRLCKEKFEVGAVNSCMLRIMEI